MMQRPPRAKPRGHLLLLGVPAGYAVYFGFTGPWTAAVFELAVLVLAVWGLWVIHGVYVREMQALDRHYNAIAEVLEKRFRSGED